MLVEGSRNYSGCIAQAFLWRSGFLMGLGCRSPDISEKTVYSTKSQGSRACTELNGMIYINLKVDKSLILSRRQVYATPLGLRVSV